MTHLSVELPPKNHNNPPNELELLGENLILRHVHAIRSAESHLEIVANIPAQFTEEGEASYVTDFIKTMQNLQRELERRRKEEKDPYLRQGQYVDSFFGDWIQKLADGIAKAKRPLDDFMQRKAYEEQQKRLNEAQAMLAEKSAAIEALKSLDQEKIKASPAAAHDANMVVDHALTMTNVSKVADAIAAAPITTMARTTGKAATAGLVTKWTGAIRNVEELDLMKLRPFIPVTELQKALDRFVRQGGRQCEGADIKETVETKVK